MSWRAVRRQAVDGRAGGGGGGGGDNKGSSRTVEEANNSEQVGRTNRIASKPSGTPPDNAESCPYSPAPAATLRGLI